MKALLFLEDTRVNYLLAERDGKSGRWPNNSLWSVTVGAMRAMYDGAERASFWGVSEADLAALPDRDGGRPGHAPGGAGFAGGGDGD